MPEYETTLTNLMIQAAYEGLLVINADYVVIAHNEAVKELLELEELIGKNLLQITQSDEVDSAVRYALENGEQSFEIQTNIGEKFLRVRTYADVSYAPDYIAIAIQDITQLVRLNRARRDMVDNISHELRTPISNIRLSIETLFREADKPKRKKSIETLRSIAHETDSLLWLVQELLDLSMIESGQAIVRLVDVSVDEMITNVIERMTEQATSRDVEITKKSPKSLKALCDSDLVKRVIINLLHNALKYSPAGTEVKITAKDTEDTVTITVQDQGEGIPANQIARVFERFYQVDSSRSSNEGTGLGLAICRHIVEAHGGRIWAEGVETAKGGKFSFTVPNANYQSD